MGSLRYIISNTNGVETVEEIHRVIVYYTQNNLVDVVVEDLVKWRNSEAGQFVTKHSINPITLEKIQNPESCTDVWYIIAELEKKKLSEYYLIWSTVQF